MNQLFKNEAEGPLDLNSRIIENYKQTTSSAVRSDYLDYLARKTLSFAEIQDQERLPKEAAQEKDICRAVVERIFGLLEPYTIELNRINKLKQLHITAVPPSATGEVLEYDRNRRPLRSVTYYRARFSTSRYSLVVRGLKNRVEFFILPADRVIGLTAAEAQLEPLMVFASEGGAWWVEGKSLNTDRFERYSLLALEHLLDCTQEELLNTTTK